VKKKIYLQCPGKFADVLPIFCSEALKHDIFDGIEIATDAKLSRLDSRVSVSLLPKDMQFSSNILFLLSRTDEPIFLLCCEDHIMLDSHSVSDFEDAFKFVSSNPEVGFLRLAPNSRVEFSSESKFTGKYRELKRQYRYFIPLQPAIWRREFLMEVLKAGEDAWQMELAGSKRARKSSRFTSCCTVETVYKATNFYKEGKYLRHQFVDYCLDNGITLSRNPGLVFVKKDGRKEVISYDKYVAERKAGK